MKAEAAKNILLRCVANFPALFLDADGSMLDEVNGADLAEWLSNELWALRPDKELMDRALRGSTDGEGEE